MFTSRNQHSIAADCQVVGRGYWTANPVRVVMHPAPVNTGIVLVRSDLPGKPQCNASVAYRESVQLRTNLSHDAFRVQMVEHLMAALYAMEIDNCVVEIDGEELPGLDGSSQPYIDAISEAGLVIQAAERSRLVIRQVITLREGDAWITASPTPTGIPHFGYQLEFDADGPIPNQGFGFSCTPLRFCREVASARTFVTEQQASALRAKGIAQHVSFSDLLVFGPRGPIDNELRFRNECARHKTLDLIGDLALAGVELIGKFISHRGGHHLNGRMAAALQALTVQSSDTARRGCSDHRRAA